MQEGALLGASSPRPFQVGVESAPSMLFLVKYDRAGWSLRSPAPGPVEGIPESGFKGGKGSLCSCDRKGGRGGWCRGADRICVRSPSHPPSSAREAARPQYLLDCARRLGNGAVGAEQGLAAVAVPLVLVMRVAPLHG